MQSTRASAIKKSSGRCAWARASFCVFVKSVLDFIVGASTYGKRGFTHTHYITESGVVHNISMEHIGAFSLNFHHLLWELWDLSCYRSILYKRASECVWCSFRLLVEWHLHQCWNTAAILGQILVFPNHWFSLLIFIELQNIFFHNRRQYLFSKSSISGATHPVRAIKDGWSGDLAGKFLSLISPLIVHIGFSLSVIIFAMVLRSRSARGMRHFPCIKIHEILYSDSWHVDNSSDIQNMSNLFN